MDYVVLGTGPAGVIAAENLRKTDRSGKITLVGDEPEAPYSRMALPYLLAENIDEAGTHLRHGPSHYDDLSLEIRRDRAAAISPADKSVRLESGANLGYGKLLIATGSRPVRPPIAGMDLPGIETCWTLEDGRRIMAGTKEGSRVVLMGAGFIGCIVLEALAARKVELTVVEMADRMLARMMDDIGGELIKRWCEAKGVRVLTSTKVEAVEQANGALKLDLSSGDSIEADLVVCATGVAPNLEFLQGSGIDTDMGILVNERLETSVADIYAAGDVAQGPDFSTGEKAVHAIQPTASEHGRIAALNMAGRKTRYRGSLSMNVLNTLGLITSSFGLWMGVDGGERAEAVDFERYNYLRLEFDGDQVVGALAMGLTQHVGVIRGLVQTKVRLGLWKERLMRDPHLVMDAYLEQTKGVA